jgi:hypothetical protein
MNPALIRELIELIEEGKFRFEYQRYDESDHYVFEEDTNEKEVCGLNFSSNPAALEYLGKNPDKIYFRGLYYNTYPDYEFLKDFIFSHYSIKEEEEQELYYAQCDIYSIHRWSVITRDIYDRISGSPRIFDCMYISN